MRTANWVMIFVLTIAATGARAQNIVQPSTKESVNDCPHLPGRMPWPEPRERDGTALHHRDKPQAGDDHDDASSFEIWRSLGDAQTLRLALCFGTMHIEHSNKMHQMHLLVRLPGELPHGQSVGQFVETLQVTQQRGDIFLKVPEAYKADVILEIPDEVDVETDLGRGQIEVSSYGGNLGAHVAHGRMVLRADIDRRYKSVRAGFASGGVQDERRAGSGHLQRTFAWKHDGIGQYLLNVSFGEGVLVLRNAG
jgi:hypothetical protein